MQDADVAFHTLPADLYRSADVHRREQELIFEKSWHFACHHSQVAATGDYVRLDIGDEEILVVRDKAGVLQAYYNVCLHRAHTLVQDDAGHMALITCLLPRMDLSARRHARGGAERRERQGVRPVRFQIEIRERGGLWRTHIRQSGSAGGAAGAAGSRPARCARALVPGTCPGSASSKRATWDVQCNWKTAIENFSECYHCGPAHPALCRLR